MRKRVRLLDIVTPELAANYVQILQETREFTPEKLVAIGFLPGNPELLADLCTCPVPPGWTRWGLIMRRLRSIEEFEKRQGEPVLGDEDFKVDGVEFIVANLNDE
jgi:hypothetical protein